MTQGPSSWPGHTLCTSEQITHLLCALVSFSVKWRGSHLLGTRDASKQECAEAVKGAGRGLREQEKGETECRGQKSLPGS